MEGIEEKKEEETVVPAEEETVVPAEEKSPDKAPEKVLRQIIIETDGNSVRLLKTEVAGKIELVAILEGLLLFLRTDNKEQK